MLRFLFVFRPAKEVPYLSGSLYLVGATFASSRCAVPHTMIVVRPVAEHPIIPAKEWVVFDASWNSACRLKPIMRILKLVHGSAGSFYGRWVHLRLGMANLEKVALRALYSRAALVVIVAECQECCNRRGAMQNSGPASVNQCRARHGTTTGPNERRRGHRSVQVH